MKAVKILLVLGVMLLWIPSGTDASFGLKIERCFHTDIGEEVLCGTYEVMENRLARKGAKIRLNFIILPARTSNPAPDPVFIFSGGPGVGAADWADGYAVQYEKLRWERDIVLVDQRGTGRSNPLHCRRLGDPDLAQTYLQDMFPEEYIKECRRELEKKANLRYYHTAMAIQDIDNLRAALGYQSINIIGGSYGSYTGIAYLKYYPWRVRSAFFSLVAVPGWGYPATIAQNTEAALDRLFADCAADPDCSADYPGLRQRLDQVLIQLKQGPATAVIRNPINGEYEVVTFTHNNFIHGLRSLLYSVSGSRWIPAFIHWASSGNFSPIAEYTADYLYWVNQEIMDGMYLCVTCTETLPYIDYEAAAAAAAGTLMGTYRLDQQKNACELWIRGDHPPDFHGMYPLDTPTLVVSGELDPVTPPRYGADLASYLRNSRHVVIPNAGHELGNVWASCLDDLVAQFISQGTVMGLDATCVNGHQRPPFVSWRDYSGEDERNSSSLLRQVPDLRFRNFLREKGKQIK